MAERITIGGALAQYWIDSGALNIIADPAGNLEASIYYDRLKKNNGYIFDANDRDRLIPKDPDHKPPFGIGVYTAKAPMRFVGSPKETEIGYYPSLGEADTLTIELAKPLTNTQVTVSLFYSDESFAPEQLTYQPYYKGVPVYDPVTVTASGSSYYTKNNAGFFTFDLAGDSTGAAKIDEIVFSSVDVPGIKDGSDYLVESISGDGVPQLQISNTSAPNLVWPTRTYTFNYRETNIGNGDSPAHSTGFFLSTDETLDASDTLLGTAAEEPLGAYQSRTVSQSITLPDNLVIGNYYLIYQTDVNNVVDEQNESNDATIGDPLNTGSIRTEPIEMNGYVKKTFDLNYSASDQSIWDGGGIYDNRTLALSWDSGEREASVGIYDYRVGVRGSTSGQIGLQSNFKVDGSTLNNASLPIDLWLDVPNKVQAGDTVTIKSGYSLDPSASFSVTGPTASYSLDGIFKLNANAKAFLRGESVDIFPPLNIDQNPNLVNFNPDSQQSIDFGPFGSAQLRLPNVDTSDNASDGVLVSEVSNTFFSANLDLAAMIASFFGIPLSGDTGERGVDIGVLAAYIRANYNLLSAGINGNISLKQKLALSADRLTGQLTLENGDKYDFTVGQDLTFTVPEGIGDSLDFSANLNLGASISNKTSLGYDINGYIKALSASAEGELKVGFDSIFGFTRKTFRESVNFGPLIEGSTNLLKDEIKLYEKPFNLGDLGSQELNYSVPVFV